MTGGGLHHYTAKMSMTTDTLYVRPIQMASSPCLARYSLRLHTCWASLVRKASLRSSTAAEGSTNLRLEPTIRANRQRSSCMKATFLLSCVCRHTLNVIHLISTKTCPLKPFFQWNLKFCTSKRKSSFYSGRRSS